jgi:hypothetical protein
MDAGLKRFILLLFSLTVVLTLIGFLVIKYFVPDYYYTGFLFLPFLLFVITSVVHWYLIIASQGDNKKFTYKFMGATGLKMFVYLILIVIYLLLDKEHAVPFLICFLILYVLYSFFEVLSVLKYLKNNK